MAARQGPCRSCFPFQQQPHDLSAQGEVGNLSEVPGAHLARTVEEDKRRRPFQLPGVHGAGHGTAGAGLVDRENEAVEATRPSASTPSTRTLMLPSGSFRLWTTLATQPMV